MSRPPRACAPCCDCERVAYEYRERIGWICRPCLSVRDLRAELGGVRRVAGAALILILSALAWAAIAGLARIFGHG